MKIMFAQLRFLIVLILLITLFPFVHPAKAAGPAIAGHYLKTGEVLVGVTGSAPVANKLTGTANQITVTTAAEGGNLTLSLPASVSVTNINVTGTASWLSTGTYTAQDLIATYGVKAATGVFSGAVTGASFTASAALAGATLGTSGAATVVGAAYIGAANTVSTITAVGAATFAASVAAPSVSVGATGMMQGGVRTLAELAAATSILGEFGTCSDCTPVELFISTGAGAPNTGGYGNAVGLQLD